MKSLKFGSFLLAAFILAWVFNYKKFNKSSQDLKKEDIAVLQKAFTESSFELFGAGVDAQKIGECSALEIYKLIEVKPDQLKIFRTRGIKSLRQTLIDSIQITNARCIIKNIIDTNYRIRLSPMIEKQMLIKLREEMKEVALQSNKNLDTLCDCLISKINGLTIKQYMSGYIAEPVLTKHIGFCLDKPKE